MPQDDNPFLRYKQVAPPISAPESPPPAAAAPDDDNPFLRHKNAVAAAQTAAPPDDVWGYLKDAMKGIVAGVPNEYSNMMSAMNEAAKAEQSQPEMPSVSQKDVLTGLGLGNLPQPQTQLGRDIGAGVGAISNPASYMGGPESILGRMAIAFGSGAMGQQGADTGQQLGQAINHPVAGRVVGGLLGGTIGPMVAGSLLSGFSNSARSKRIPGNEALDAAADKDFALIRQSGVQYDPNRVDTYRQNMLNQLKEDGFTVDPDSAPGAYAKIERMDPKGDPVDVSDLLALRKAFSKASQKRDFKGILTDDALASRRMLEHIDDLMTSPANAVDPYAVAYGVGPAFERAKGNWAAMRQSQQIEDLGYRKLMQAASSGSGANIENSLRRSIGEILTNPKRRAGYSSEEIAMMESIVKGNLPQNSVRLIGKLAATGVVPAAGATYIASHFFPGNPEAAAMALAAAGYTAKKTGEWMVRSKINKLGQSIRADSPLGEAANIPQRTTILPYAAGPFLGQLPYSQP